MIIIYTQILESRDGVPYVFHATSPFHRDGSSVPGRVHRERGTTHICAPALIVIPDSGEQREQTLYLGEIVEPWRAGAVQHALHQAFTAMHDTLEARALRMLSREATPQLLVKNSTRIQTALNAVSRG